MRRNGKTTRHVNDAVEALFKHKKIIVPIGRDYADEGLWEYMKKQLVPEQVIVDDDAMLVAGANNSYTNEIQNHLLEKIYYRLKHENGHLFHNDLIDFGGLHKNLITLKDGKIH